MSKDPTTGNFTVSEDPIDITTDKYVSSVDISDDGLSIVAGLNAHDGDLVDQGQGVSFMVQDTGEWTGVRKVGGSNENDLLGARVRITGNGQIAAASSRSGYVSFFAAARLQKSKG